MLIVLIKDLREGLVLIDRFMVQVGLDRTFTGLVRCPSLGDRDRSLDTDFYYYYQFILFVWLCVCVCVCVLSLIHI